MSWEDVIGGVALVATLVAALYIAYGFS